jgi:hypothetical protein
MQLAGKYDPMRHGSWQKIRSNGETDSVAAPLLPSKRAIDFSACTLASATKLLRLGRACRLIYCELLVQAKLKRKVARVLLSCNAIIVQYLCTACPPMLREISSGGCLRLQLVFSKLKL